MSQSGSDIPPDVKRAVREACGYGCVVCGLPIYEYDHIVERTLGGPHTVENIALLCPNHHTEKGGLLDQDKVRAARRDPINIRQGATAPWRLHYGPKPVTMFIGSNAFISAFPFIALSIDEFIVLAVNADENGQALVSALFFNEYGMPILNIVDNELVHRASGLDFEVILRRPPVPEGKGARLIVRWQPRRILLELEFVPPHALIVRRGRILVNGVNLRIFEDRIVVRDVAVLDAEGKVVSVAPMELVNNLFSDSPHHLHFGRPQPYAAFNPAGWIEEVVRYRR